MSQNAFQSEKLQSAFNKLEGKSELLNQNIDAISGEIKTLEEKLQELKLPLTIKVQMAISTLLKIEEQEQIKIYPDTSFKALEYLMWERDETSGKFRLLYQRVLNSEDIPGLHIVSVLRPLIECPMTVRLKMHPQLSKLVDALAEQIDL